MVSMMFGWLISYKIIPMLPYKSLTDMVRSYFSVMDMPNPGMENSRDKRYLLALTIT